MRVAGLARWVIARQSAKVVMAALAWLLLAMHATAAEPKDAAKDLSPTVAILYFDYEGKDEQLALLRKGLAQILINELESLDGVRIVERARLQAAIDEMKLNHSVRFDPATASRLGKLLGARYLVLGNYQYYEFVKSLRINADVVDVSTGVHVGGAAASGKQEEFLTMQQKLTEGLTKTFTTRLTGLEPSRQPAAGIRSRPRPKPPARLAMSTVVQYGKALDAIDRGDKASAMTALQAVIKEQPDFALAPQDLDRLMQ